MELKEVVAVITGGASGLGKATAQHIVAAGGKAILLDIDHEKGQVFAASDQDHLLFVDTDVTDEQAVLAALNAGIKKFGDCNVVVNCAGTGSATKILSKHGIHSLQQFSRIIDINLIGTFNVLRLAADLMQTNDADEDGQRGVIINTASVAAFDGQIGQAAYSASKGAIVSMALPLARELADVGIRVMTIAPGMVETPMFASLPESVQQSLGAATPFPKRLGKASEYALLVEGIIRNTLLNGEVIRMDGAIRMQPK
ncbi:SDR family NAD(P)-dependent oxidoreductase [Kurthia sibirica]|uniref:3-hydroxyacyl-CoA dehydrogenase n=1 Tax=Kurthia sibirica TaxID=202750 RepID=A0A2U3APR4_9BACL|nr:SDR family NAD(P)-dependent oxidoreductase [Kurthia sibirica]PWI26514.1 3-hydroxyacyl-CoA dehydrogenase [Kurthia sibirica]GEK32758.1 3-hydroxyacyl-CoA dehydrogenase [Kurthia sibirica]